ncbi:MAG: DUF2764 family protein [Chromatiaceae bacterium]|nr:MAG: DUF2764 family protein [Chromatiaceae bacterium]
MASSTRYVMLLTALPYHGPLFGAKQTPLSRLRLDQYLRMLDPVDAARLRAARGLIDFSEQVRGRADADTATNARRVLAAIDHPFVRDLVTWRLEMHTLIAAMRRRQAGQPAPEDSRWGIGRWVERIRRHWGDPTFGLEQAVPWLDEGHRLLERGAALELERLLMARAWDHLERLSDGHYFDFEAVVIYVARWELIAHWTSFDAEAAGARFDALLADATSGLAAALDAELQRLAA